MIRAWLLSLGISLALTLAIELAAAYLTGKRGRALAVVALVNTLTNPPVVLTVLLWQRHGLPGLPLLIAALELGAVLAEGGVYRLWREDFPHPWRFSLALNALSYALGVLLQAIF